jgi:hypothetical protein
MQEVKRLKDEAAAEVKAILMKVEQDYPGLIEGLGTAVGAASGGAVSFFALSSLGTAGLSGAGITSGLATAGAIVGGGMVAGIGVLAAPVAGLAVGGFWLANKRKKSKLAAALGLAIGKLYAIQSRLVENAEYFKEEIAGIKVAIDMLNRKNPATAGTK